MRWLINGFALLSLETTPQMASPPPKFSPLSRVSQLPWRGGLKRQRQQLTRTARVQASRTQCGVTTSLRGLELGQPLPPGSRAPSSSAGKARFLGLPLGGCLTAAKTIRENPKSSKPWSVCGSERFHCMRDARGTERCF